MTTLIQELAITDAPGLDGPAVIPVNDYGVPSLGLVRQFKFDETSLSSGVEDSINNEFFPLAGADSSSALAGGGLLTEGYRYIQGPEIDLTKPVTVGFIVQRDAPSSWATSGQSFMGIASTVVLSGWRMFLAALDPDAITAGSPHGGYVDPTAEGAALTRLTIAKPWSARYDQSHAFFFRSLGNGEVQFIQRTRSAITILAATWDLSDLANNATNLLLIGGERSDAELRHGELTWDLGAVWDRAISSAAMEAFTRRGLEIAASRGRT